MNRVGHRIRLPSGIEGEVPSHRLGKIVTGGAVHIGKPTVERVICTSGRWIRIGNVFVFFHRLAGNIACASVQVKGDSVGGRNELAI